MKTCSVDIHKNCIELTSGNFRIAVTTEVGPRVIGGWIGGSDNIFRILPVSEGGKDEFQLYGGHRLWHSPEAKPRSYVPDNNPVIVSEVENGFEFSAVTEGLTGIKKAVTIEAIDNGFRLTHRLMNCNAWPVTLAPWALSVMAPGGMAILPQHRDTEANPFAPDRRLVLWPYTSYADPRIVYGNKYIFLKQDSSAEKAAKIGMNADEGWIGYVNKSTAFIKYFEVFDEKETEYPDFGCNVESYSCNRFCEIETVAPLYELNPEEECEHVEFWQGISDLPEIKTEEDIDKYIEPQLL
ncbi:MAG: hypothetical protein J6X55_09490 [Victivallales bacterium]|nr:hypothetical protein [Victivallales bacterium]